MEFHAAAAAKIPGLPPAAYTALMDTLVAVARDPWRVTEHDSPLPPEFRWALFDEEGLVSVYLDDSSWVVRIHDVLWAG